MPVFHLSLTIRAGIHGSLNEQPAARYDAALRANLDDVPEVASGSRGREVIAIDQALDALAEIDPRKSKVVELRFLEVSAWKRQQK